MGIKGKLGEKEAWTLRKRRGGRKEIDGRRRKWKKGGGRKDGGRKEVEVPNCI